MSKISYYILLSWQKYPEKRNHAGQFDSNWDILSSFKTNGNGIKNMSY